LDAFGQSILFSLFFIGLILGGQKILGDARGRSVFTKTIVMFTIVMTCIQIPFWTSGEALLAGAFETTAGFMLIGMVGVIVLVWFGLKQKAWSLPFIFYMVFAAMTFIFMLLTGGRTVLAGTLLGILMLLVRRIRRNVVILLATLIILAPIGLRIITSFPGFEAVERKLFSLGTTGRAELWALAWDEIKVKPIIGWGTGAASIKSPDLFGVCGRVWYSICCTDDAFILVVSFPGFISDAKMPYRGNEGHGSSILCIIDGIFIFELFWRCTKFYDLRAAGVFSNCLTGRYSC
jgi:hypothetical protein